MKLLDRIIHNAQELKKTIVLPEGSEERTLKAADYVLKNDIAKIILLGDEAEIMDLAHRWQLENIPKAQIINPLKHKDKDFFAQKLFQLRKHKGLSLEAAQKWVEDPLVLAPLMIKTGFADGEIAGAENSTGNVLRPAFQIVSTAKGVKGVSGVFIMILEKTDVVPDGILIFADCAVVPDPNSETLAEIAVLSAKTAKQIAGIEPKVAMLSFSTKESACHPKVDKVIEAVRLAKEMDPELNIDGDLQADAALVHAIGKRKAPDSKVAGHANILIFPSLESGNISYKLVQRLAGAEAIGPILQGLAAPINDLSRGCSITDIINMIAITANQAESMKIDTI